MQVYPKECGEKCHLLKNFKDVRCNNEGIWINNGVRKIYLCIDHHTNPKKLNVTVIKHGGKAPSVPHWCLTIRISFLKIPRVLGKALCHSKVHLN